MQPYNVDAYQGWLRKQVSTGLPHSAMPRSTSTFYVLSTTKEATACMINHYVTVLTTYYPGRHTYNNEHHTALHLEKEQVRPPALYRRYALEAREISGQDEHFAGR